MSNNLLQQKIKENQNLIKGGPRPIHQRGLGGGRCHAPDDIVILELLEERDLADGRARHALVLRLEPDLLERDDLVRRDVFRFVHDAVRACPCECEECAVCVVGMCVCIQNGAMRPPAARERREFSNYYKAAWLRNAPSPVMWLW